MFAVNNARFCCQGKEKILYLNTFGRRQICNKKDQNGNFY